MTATGDLDPVRIGELHATELARFRQARPRSLAMTDRARAHMPNGVPMAWMAQDNDQPVYIDRGQGPGFTDVDGFTYLDFNASDVAMFCGHAHPAIVAAVQAQAARSTQFLLPTVASVEVAEELARRYPVPHWQFTLSASQANTEVIRLARAVTGREVIVLFQGHYHGHFEEGLVDLEHGQAAAVQRGLSKGVTGRVRIAQFNDLAGLRAALEPGDVALVLTEPAMTNNLHLLLPEPGWHQALRALTRRHGTLLALDETHTHVVGPGGATAMWHLEPDTVTLGKAVAGGLPMGAYGVTAELGEHLDAARNLATGGTLFGNPLSAAAAKAALTQVLVSAAYAHTTALGRQLADGIDHAIKAAGLPWTAIRLGPRSGQWYGPMPRTGAQAHALTDDLLTRLIRIWLANRGIWDALPGAGPTVPVPATTADVTRYVEAYSGLLARLRLLCTRSAGTTGCQMVPARSDVTAWRSSIARARRQPSALSPVHRPDVRPRAAADANKRRARQARRHRRTEKANGRLRPHRPACRRQLPEVTVPEGGRRWQSRFHVTFASCSEPPTTCTYRPCGPMAHPGTRWCGPGSKTTTVMGADLHFGRGETDSGTVVFTGDSEKADTFFGLTGVKAASMQNCTNQTWDISNPARTRVAASTRPGMTANITPTTGAFTNPARGQASPFTDAPQDVPSWDLTG